MASDHIRASDRDRDAVVATLRDAYSEGRLSLEEFQERSTAAYAGRSWGDLKELTTDLPVQPSLGADLPPEARPVPAPDEVPGARPEERHPMVPSASGLSPETPYPGVQPPGSAFPGAQPPGSQYPGQPPADRSLPPARHRRGHPYGPLLPVVGMWVLFALAARSTGGAILFLVAVALLVALTSIGRRPARGGPGGPPR
jgi:hypothetical protein